MKRYRQFTEKELKWVKSFQRVMKSAPENLFIFAGSGDFVVYPKDEDGKRYMNKWGSVDGDAPSINVKMPCESDGGDW